MSDTELKECPFCGEEAKIEFDKNEVFSHGKKGSWFIWCKKCGVLFKRRTELEAIAAWNNRV